MKRWIGLPICVVLVLFAMTGCGAPTESSTDVPSTEELVVDPPTDTAEPTTEPDPTDTSEPDPTDTAEPEPTETPAEELFLGFLISDAGFETPESVLYDSEADVYLVSNINGRPSAEDGNGFISRISPEGVLLDLKWIDGASDDVDLDAPKGMALAGDKLYVADINDVRVFDRMSGAFVETIPFPDARFLNDMCDDNGTGVYVSDSGAGVVYTFGASGAMGDFFVPHVNGIYVLDGQFYATSSNGVVKTSVDGVVPAIELPADGLDGLIMLTSDSALVSSWSGKVIYYATAAGDVVELNQGEGMADIGYDSLRHRILIPYFNDNIVAVYPLHATVPQP